MSRAALPDKLGRAKGMKVMVIFNAKTDLDMAVERSSDAENNRDCA